MRPIQYLLLLIINVSCGYGGFSDSIIEDYEVTWDEDPHQQAICRKTSSTSCSVIVAEYIFAVGHNEEFIIAKQHPTNRLEVNTTITNYYIIDIRNEDEEIYGPLQEAVFNASREKFGIAHIEFDMIYSEAP